jgi:hypothetical protein
VTTFASNVIPLSDLTHYGISTSKTTFVGISDSDGLLYNLISDLTDSWVMYNGNSLAGNELIDSLTSNIITKQFFVVIYPINGYDGNGNYTNISGGDAHQHVVVLESTNELLTGQPFRLRFEYDERPRLYNDDIEFNDELIQTNIRLQSMGYDRYIIGNTISDSSYMSNESVFSSHMGYTFNGVLDDINWKENIGIPNPMYGWVKVNTCAPFGLLSNGDIGGSVDYSVIARTYGQMVDVTYKDILIPSSFSSMPYTIRNKVRGDGWFKPHNGHTSYRLTMTERGIVVSVYQDSPSVDGDDQSWFVIQRTVDNVTGLINTNSPSVPSFETNPIHCMYSCSKDIKYPSDKNMFYITDINTLQSINNTTMIYDKLGVPHTLSSITDPNIGFGEVITVKVNDNDLDEDHIIDYNPNNIWRFVVQEVSNLSPWGVHVAANHHSVDSEAVINSSPQISISHSNQLLFNFPGNFTTGRCVYPDQEMDLICSTSSEVVSEGSITSLGRYSPDGVTSEYRKYCGVRSSLGNSVSGNQHMDGMRIMVLCRSDYIFNSDINI